MGSDTTARILFLINIVALCLLIVNFALLIRFDITFPYRNLKIVLLAILILTIFFGLSQSIQRQIRSLTKYYIGLIVSPILVGIVSILSGGGLSFLFLIALFVNSIFESDKGLARKDNLLIKRAFSLASNQSFEVRMSNGLFEKKTGNFYSSIKFTSFNLLDSSNTTYIELINENTNENSIELLEK
jgi:hypothetical protein